MPRAITQRHDCGCITVQYAVGQPIHFAHRSLHPKLAPVQRDFHDFAVRLDHIGRNLSAAFARDMDRLNRRLEQQRTRR